MGFKVSPAYLSFFACIQETLWSLNKRSLLSCSGACSWCGFKKLQGLASKGGGAEEKGGTSELEHKILF
jgi:hypothetical protein